MNIKCGHRKVSGELRLTPLKDSSKLQLIIMQQDYPLLSSFSKSAKSQGLNIQIDCRESFVDICFDGICYDVGFINKFVSVLKESNKFDIKGSVDLELISTTFNTLQGGML